jgi:hypothetical protein
VFMIALLLASDPSDSDSEITEEVEVTA